MTLPSEPEALRNVMINYIPSFVDEMQLRHLFEMYGPLESIKIICDRETRQSRGYGFAKFCFGFSALQAIQYLNGYPILNKRLKVSYANPAEAQKALTDPTNPFAGGYANPQQYFMQQMTVMQMFHRRQMSGGGGGYHPMAGSFGGGDGYRYGGGPTSSSRRVLRGSGAPYEEQGYYE